MSTHDSGDWQEAIERNRERKERYFRENQRSPIPPELRDEAFPGLDFYDVDPDYRFELELDRYDDPETVVVGFGDDGTGVPEEVREDIFEMGQKGPDSDGTGLGLGFVRALTESYGGTVELRESDAGGADFRVVLERA